MEETWTRYVLELKILNIHGQGHGRRGGGDPQGAGAWEGGVVENFFTRGVVY